jgi:hypothetical protein
MDRRKALAVSVAVALVVVGGAALAANFGLLGLVDSAEPVGQLSPVTPVGSTVVPAQRATQGEGAVGDGGPSGTPGVEGGGPADASSVEDPGQGGRDDHRTADEREHEPEPEHERDD